MPLVGWHHGRRRKRLEARMLGLHRPVPDHHQNLAQRGLPPQPVADLQITDPRVGARDRRLRIVVAQVISHMLEGKMRRLVRNWGSRILARNGDLGDIRRDFLGCLTRDTEIRPRLCDSAWIPRTRDAAASTSCSSSLTDQVCIAEVFDRCRKINRAGPALRLRFGAPGGVIGEVLKNRTRIRAPEAQDTHADTRRWKSGSLGAPNGRPSSKGTASVRGGLIFFGMFPDQRDLRRRNAFFFEIVCKPAHGARALGSDRDQRNRVDIVCLQNLCKITGDRLHHRRRCGPHEGEMTTGNRADHALFGQLTAAGRSGKDVFTS